MNLTFFDYMQRLEMMAFFTGYPLVYAIIHFVAGSGRSKPVFKRKIVFLLPFAYALVGTLYIGLQLKNLYPDYSIENIRGHMQEPLLMVWSMLSLLFWVPFIAKKTVISLLHSLVYFLLLIKDLFLHAFKTSFDQNLIRNDMKLYSDSIILNLGALTIVFIISYFLTRFQKNITASGV